MSTKPTNAALLKRIYLLEGLLEYHQLRTVRDDMLKIRAAHTALGQSFQEVVDSDRKHADQMVILMKENQRLLRGLVPGNPDPMNPVAPPPVPPKAKWWRR